MLPKGAVNMRFTFRFGAALSPSGGDGEVDASDGEVDASDGSDSEAADSDGDGDGDGDGWHSEPKTASSPVLGGAGASSLPPATLDMRSGRRARGYGMYDTSLYDLSASLYDLSIELIPSSARFGSPPPAARLRLR
jgi:hypothetical protein